MSKPENEKRKNLPPYISFKTFLTFLDSLKVGVPSHIDRSIMGNLSGGAQSGLISALSYMKLMTSDNVPTERLSELVKSQGSERQTLFCDLWGETYSDIGVDFDTTTTKQLEDALEGTGANGETVDKCKAFLQALAKAGGVKLSPHLKNLTRRARVPKKRISVLPSGTNGPENHRERNSTELTPEQMLIEILDTDQMDEEEQQAVWTLLKYLKKQSYTEE